MKPAGCCDSPPLEEGNRSGLGISSFGPHAVKPAFPLNQVILRTVYITVIYKGRNVMKHRFALIILGGMLTTQAFGAGKGPEIRIVDNKVSMDVESISLSRLLNLFDRATG